MHTSDIFCLSVMNRTPEQQLRLFDIRVQRTELHCFGWKQEASDSQSGYISQSWSPDGLYCASGSTDPKIHIFDIRYNSREPVQTLDAHQKRVFKAAWHPNLPLLLSISSDLFVGMHKIF
jgi:WD40 repeat protein